MAAKKDEKGISRHVRSSKIAISPNSYQFLAPPKTAIGNRTRTTTRPYVTKANAAGRRGGLQANSAITKKQGPHNSAATHQPAILLVASPIKRLGFCSSMNFSLPGAPVTSASRLLGVELAVLILLLASKLGQGQSNYQLAHEELRERSSAVLKNRCLLPLALRGRFKPLSGTPPPRSL